MPLILASLFDSLDGVAYFFVSSGLFVLVTAALFFSLGLWIGALTWGRFKRRFRAGQDAIEELKNELALLKRRAADLATRAPVLLAGQPPAASKSALASLVRSASKPPLPAPRPSAAFTLWTEPNWTPPATARAPLIPSAAFSLWPLPESAVEIVHATATSTTAAGTGEALHFTVEHAPKTRTRKLPKSRAFTVWTEAGFEPHRVHKTGETAS